MIETAIASLLVADSTVTDLIGTDPGARIYPIQLPQPVEQTTEPTITYLRVSTAKDETHDGPSGLVLPARIQINSWAKTWTDARALAAAVEGRLDGFRGIAAGVKIGRIHLDVMRDEPPTQARLLHQIIQQYLVTARE